MRRQRRNGRPPLTSRAEVESEPVRGFLPTDVSGEPNEAASRHSRNIEGPMLSIRNPSPQPLKLADPPRRHPFRHEDVAVVAKARVVRMNETAVPPELAVVPNALRRRDPLDVLSQLGHDLILGVQQRHPRVQFRNEHQIPVRVDVGRQTVARQRFDVLPIERQILQRVMSTIANHDLLLPPRPAVDPGCSPV